MREDIAAVRSATRNGTLLEFVQESPDDTTLSLVRTLARERDEDGRRLIFDAVCSGNVDVAKYVLSLVDQKDDVVNEQDDNKWTPLMSACSCNQMDMVNWLLSVGADVSSMTQEKRSAVFYAASKASGSLVTRVLKAYGDIGINPLYLRDSLGSTVFHRAVANGNIEALSALFEYQNVLEKSEGRDKLGDFLATAKDANGDTIYDICSNYAPNKTKKDEMIKILSEHGAGL